MKMQLISALAVVFLPISLHADSFTTNLLTNPGADAGSTAGWTVGGDSNPGVDSGSFDPGINPHSGSYDFYGHTGDFGSLSQTVSLLTQGVTAAQINSGMVTANLSFWEQGLNQGTPSDDGEVMLTFMDGSGDTISSVSSGEVDSHNGTWENFSSSYLVPDGAQSVTYEMEFIRHAGTDNDSFIDDNSLVLDTAGSSTSPAVTPEPGSLILIASGMLTLAAAARRRLSKA